MDQSDFALLASAMLKGARDCMSKSCPPKNPPTKHSSNGKQGESMGL
jgi:hypothetical protein